jgi:hypothetical protein
LNEGNPDFATLKEIELNVSPDSVTGKPWGLGHEVAISWVG